MDRTLLTEHLTTYCLPILHVNVFSPSSTTADCCAGQGDAEGGRQGGGLPQPQGGPPPQASDPHGSWRRPTGQPGWSRRPQNVRIRCHLYGGRQPSTLSTFLSIDNCDFEFYREKTGGTKFIQSSNLTFWLPPNV